MRPTEATLIPFPTELTTPPVTKMYFAIPVVQPLFVGGFRKVLSMHPKEIAEQRRSLDVEERRCSTLLFAQALGAQPLLGISDFIICALLRGSQVRLIIR
jgi:hypothetical protein